jgi:hypothetical protein
MATSVALVIQDPSRTAGPEGIPRASENGVVFDGSA